MADEFGLIFGRIQALDPDGCLLRVATVELHVRDGGCLTGLTEGQYVTVRYRAANGERWAEDIRAE